jgi:predicted deacylase
MPGPHDLLARYTFSHPERAAAELRAVLPPELAAQVDWSTVSQESTSVVDPQVLHSVAEEQGTEELMTTMAEAWLEEGMAKGMAVGKAEAVLQILIARGIAVDEQTRQSILSCTDLAMLDRWLDQALRATSLSELLKDT